MVDVRGSRFTDKYLQTRYNSSLYRGGPASDILYPALPPRPGTAPTAPGSPPRKVISEFKPFAAGAGLSVADAPLGLNVEDANANAPKAEEDDEVDKLAQSVELRFAGISLEQVRPPLGR
ncbi:hypothetical protein JCM10449v2_007722 [Rhodotorula kratochvilovae]